MTCNIGALFLFFALFLKCFDGTTNRPIGPTFSIVLIAFFSQNGVFDKYNRIIFQILFFLLFCSVLFFLIKNREIIKTNIDILFDVFFLLLFSFLGILKITTKIMLFLICIWMLALLYVIFFIFQLFIKKYSQKKVILPY